jgi:hypothetical protein
MKEFMIEAGALKGRDLRLEVRRIRYGAFRDRFGMSFGSTLVVVTLRHLVDVTISSARTSSRVPAVGALYFVYSRRCPFYAP